MLTRQNRQNMMSIYISVKYKVYYEGFPKKFLIGFLTSGRGWFCGARSIFLISYALTLENLSRTSGKVNKQTEKTKTCGHSNTRGSSE